MFQFQLLGLNSVTAVFIGLFLKPKQFHIAFSIPKMKEDMNECMIENRL